MPLPLALILSLASTAAQQGNQMAAEHDRERAAADAERRNSILRAAADRRVNDEIQKVTKSNPDDARAETQAQFMDALRRAKVRDGSADLGGGGDTFTADLGAAGAAQSADSAHTAATLAAIDAPALQRQREGASFNRAATDLDLLRSQSQSNDFLAQLRQSLIRPNPGVDSAANFGQAFAGALAKRAQKPVKPGVAGFSPAVQAAVDAGGG